MPRHSFRFPSPVINAVRTHVSNAIAAIDPERFAQEPNYTAALLARLVGTAYDGEFGRVDFDCTVFNDRGPNSAESRLGADHSITATVSDGSVSITKAILVQAKLGTIESMSPGELNKLKIQIGKMKALVDAPKVMEIVDAGGRRMPAIVSGNKVLAGDPFKAMPLPNYVVARVLTTFDGCTSPDVVSAVRSSALPDLNIRAMLHRR